MRISAKVEYAVLAMVELAKREGVRTKSSVIAEATGVPAKFLEAILVDLRQDGLISGARGPEGGHRIERDPAVITVADVIRAVEGPLAEVHGERPEESDERLRNLWVAVRVALREVLEHVTIEDLAAGRVPPAAQARLDAPDAWISR